MKIIPKVEKGNEPEWIVFLQSLPKPISLEELKLKYRSLSLLKDRVIMMENILRTHESYLPQVYEYRNLALEQFGNIMNGREKDDGFLGKTFTFFPRNFEFPEDGVIFRTIDNLKQIDLGIEDENGNKRTLNEDEIIFDDVYHSAEEVTPLGITYLKIAKCFDVYIQNTDLLRKHIKHETNVFSEIQKSTDTSITENGFNRVKQSHLIWYIYELKLLKKYEPIVIYRKISDYFRNQNGDFLNEKSFLSALQKGGVIKEPTNDVEKTKKKIKELFKKPYT